MDTINHECYVSFEVAKLLKEAGFDWPTRYSYDLFLYSTEGEKRVIDGFASTFCNEHNGLASMPTLDVAQRWLREVMNLSVHVFMSPYQSEDKYKWAYSIIYEVCIGRYITYEEALEAGEKKALELILENRE